MGNGIPVRGSVWNCFSGECLERHRQTELRANIYRFVRSDSMQEGRLFHCVFIH